MKSRKFFALSVMFGVAGCGLQIGNTGKPTGSSSPTSGENPPPPPAEETQAAVLGQDGVYRATVGGPGNVSTQVTLNAGPLAGAAVTFPPGSLAVSTEITVKEGATLTTSAAASQLGISGTVTPISSTLVVEPSQAVDPSGSIALTIPVAGSSLSLLGQYDFTRMAVIYRARSFASPGAARLGVLPPAQFQYEGGKVKVQVTFFGEFQVVFLETAVTDAHEVTETSTSTNTGTSTGTGASTGTSTGTGTTTVTPPVCGSDESLVSGACVTLPLTAMTNASDCRKHSGFWYDIHDFERTDPAGFDALVPSCHVAPNEGCPVSGMLRYGKAVDNTIVELDLDSEPPYISVDSSLADLAEVYSSLRCVQSPNLTLMFTSMASLPVLDLRLNPTAETIQLTGSYGIAQLNLPATATLLTLDIEDTVVNPNTISFAQLPSLTDVRLPAGLTTMNDLPSSLTYLSLSSTTLPTVNLQRFTNLSTYKCQSCNIASINVTGMTSLTGLYLSDNDLTSIDVSTNTNLTQLILDTNSLSSLNVSPLTGLVNLNVIGNNLASLNLSGLTALQSLGAANNNLTTLSVSTNTALRTLNVKNNALTALDVTNNHDLFMIDVRNNNLTYDGSTTVWDLSQQTGATGLTLLYVTGNPNLVLKIEFGTSHLLPPQGEQWIYATAAQWSTFLGSDKGGYTYHPSVAGSLEYYSDSL